MRALIIFCLTRALRRICPRIKSLDFAINDGHHIHKVKHMNTQLNELQEVTFTVAETSAGNNIVLPAAPPDWNNSDETVVTLVVAADGMSAVAKSLSKLGMSLITVTSDGFEATAEITVVAGPAVGLTLSAGAVTDIPAAAATTDAAAASNDTAATAAATVTVTAAVATDTASVAAATDATGTDTAAATVDTTAAAPAATA